MRPIKEIFVEQYWDIGYRLFKDGDSVIGGGKKKFSVLKATDRYWYADPFLFEKDGEIYLFVEMFDNVTELGVIGVSRYSGGRFTFPEPVIREGFHLSYPFVFEENGKVFIMPETHEDKCVQIYEAVEFPYKWKKSKTVLNGGYDLVDTVIYKDRLFVSKVIDAPQMITRLEIYDKTGKKCEPFPASEESQLKRGAGRIFEDGGRVIRPAQNCADAFYGKGIILYNIKKFTDSEYEEEKIGEIVPENIIAGSPAVEGTHTYARIGNIEIVDIKRKRFNFRRLLWIAKKKI